MYVRLKPGKYVVAVSGGVDSMALLDVLRRMDDVELVVAHFDHGIRTDSAKDRELAQRTARQYGLPFEYEEGHLGARASEAKAREARYAFLRKVMQKHGARAIITAHHQDDVLETAVLNMLRGTGRKGLSSLKSQGNILRPLLNISKSTILAYAHKNRLAWREDSTNADQRYLRNYIRHSILSKATIPQRQALLRHINKAEELNKEIDQLLGVEASQELKRGWFIGLPYAVSAEVITAWLRAHGVQDINRKMVHRLAVAGKTARPGAKIDIDATHLLLVSKSSLVLARR